MCILSSQKKKFMCILFSRLLSLSLKYLHLCHQSKKEVLILKFDFVKAFDKIEHQTMLQIMHHKGFGSAWLWNFISLSK